MDLIEFYVNLVIKQYWENQNAKNEVTFKAGQIKELNDFFESLKVAFDLDFAVDDRLDKIGKLVGISRVVPLSVPKKFFGFSDNPLSYGFADRFNSSILTYPFKDKFEPAYTDSQLNNDLYRKFIKLKIANNVCHAVMTSDDTFYSIQDVIYTAFDGNAYVVDNKNMTLTLYIDYSVDLQILAYIQALGLLPTPQGVDYNYITQYSAGGTFGFADNANSLGFADRFDSSIQGGLFANRIV